MVGMRRAKGRVWLRARRGLPAIIVIYALLGLLWSFVVPLGEGPDEPGHMRYALFVHKHGRLPVQSDAPATSDVPGEGHQPPLAYLFMQPFIAWLEKDESNLRLYGNPNFRWNGGMELNAYFHGVAERPPYRGAILAWHLARLGSLMLGGISVVLCWATIRRIWPMAPALALGAAALVAWNPQWIFHHALVSNDPLLIALSSLLIYLSVVAVQGNPSPPLPLVCGATLGLMLLTKQSALALLPVPLLGLFLGRRSLRDWGVQSATVLAITAAIAGWWYARNWMLYGDPLGLQVFQLTFASGDFQLWSRQSWREGGWNLLRSSVGAFGWMTLPLPDGFYAVVRAALVVALAGLLVRAGAEAWHGRGRTIIVLVAAAGLVLLWMLIFAATAGAVAWQGRFLFPAMPALAALLAAGLSAALPRRSGLWGVVLLGLVLAAALPFTLIRPTYDSPALAASEVPRGGIYTRFDLGWKRGIELHDASFERVTPTGGSLPIALTWHLVEQVHRPWTVFLHLVDQEGRIVAQHDAQPLAGRVPTDAWVPGDWFRDEHRLLLRNVAPGTYHLRIGLFDPATTERLGVYGADGLLRGDFVDLGEVRIRRQ